MSSAALGGPDMHRREAAIIDYLRLRPDGATAREIHEAVSAAIEDTVSRPAYYKILNRLLAAGKIDAADQIGPSRFVLAPQLHAANRLTLDDIYELLPFMESTESMARALEAQKQFLENRDTIVRQAAEALAKEPAADLFQRWIVSLLTQLEADLDLYHYREEDGPHAGQAVLADGILEHRLQTQCEMVRDILYRHLSIPLTAVNLPDWEGLHGLKHVDRFDWNVHKLGDALKLRVFGVGAARAVLGLEIIDAGSLTAAEEELIVSGSDGSFHAGTLGIRTAQGYIEDDSFVVTFNNSVAYVRPSERVTRQKGNKRFVHSAPMTRRTLDDPTYKGMVLAPFMFPTLTDSEYEHMTRAASDVVQMRVDDEVISGKARDLITGEQIMAPRVHIRDGTVTPQERGFNHYSMMNPYGDIAREGIARSSSILKRIEAARGTPQVYAGAVKSTQIRLFSRLVNWYIAQGSRDTIGAAIAAEWDSARASYISDVDLMTALLSSLPARKERDGFWRTCVVIRQFASLTDFFYTDPTRDGGWFGYLCQMRQRSLDDYERYRGELPYFALQSAEDLLEDPYLHLLERADYASFYVGHTAGSPAPKIPRYEFLCSLRKDSAPMAEEKAQRAVRQITIALLTCKFSEDRDHNYLSRLTIAKLIPSVVYQAHELAKALGKKLEGDYKSAVVAKLAARRGRRLDEQDVDVRPAGLRQYLQRFVDARKELPPSERHDDER